MTPLTEEQQFIVDAIRVCRSKGEEAYNFWAFQAGPCGCAATQIVEALGGEMFDRNWKAMHRLKDNPLRAEPCTFSALASRLEALLPFKVKS